MDSAKIEDESTHFKMDIEWSFFLKMKDPSGAAMFKRLVKIVILVLPSHTQMQRKRGCLVWLLKIKQNSDHY